MKNIENVKEEYEQCPKGHGRNHLCFTAQGVHCDRCNAHYDLGMKIWY